MPDAVELVESDHREVEQLFQRFQQTGDYEIARKICRELTIHAQLEEELLYPMLHATDRQLAEEAQQEHDEAKHLIARVEGMSPSDADLRAVMEQLQQAVEHHVEEEEGEALPKLRREAGYRMMEVGERFARRKEELMRGGAQPTGAGGGDRVIDLREKTKDELYQEARRADIPGRSNMTKDELVHALAERS